MEEKITTSCLHVLQVLADVTDGRMPTYGEIAERSGHSKSRLHILLRDLADASLLTIARNERGRAISAMVMPAGYQALGRSCPQQLLELHGWDSGHFKHRPSRRYSRNKVKASPPAPDGDDGEEDDRYHGRFEGMRPWEHDWYGGLDRDQLWFVKRLEELTFSDILSA
jgi:hypothetical protein